jgi:hypothetical protein
MGRPVALELRAADYAARHFVRTQGAEARKLGYPTMAAFAKDIARGTVSLLPTPDDERLEFIGRFFHTLPRPLQQALLVAYDDTGENAERRAYELGRRLSRKVTRREYFEYRKHALILLSGYLIAIG